jgi:hypothetical protein
MEEVSGPSPLSSTLHQYGSHKVEHRQPLANLAGVIRTSLRCLWPPGVPPPVQTVQTGPIRRGSQMVKVDAGQGRG